VVSKNSVGPIPARFPSAHRKEKPPIALTRRFTCDLARLEGPSPMMQALLAALNGSADDTRRFMGTVATTVPISEFYAPNNLTRIMRASGRA
jgi:hypothetical protein